MAIELISKIKPKNNGDFAIADACDVAYKDGRLTDYMPECVTQEEYDSLKASNQIKANTPYLIVEDDNT